MNLLLSKFLSKSASKTWSAFRSEVEKDLAPLRDAFSRTVGFPARIDAARSAYLADPTEERLSAWIGIEAQREGAFRVSQSLREELNASRDAALRSEDCVRRARAALEEIRDALEKQRADVLRHDADREAETGIHEESTATLQAIETQFARVDEGLAWLATDPPRAIGILESLLH